MLQMWHVRGNGRQMKLERTTAVSRRAEAQGLEAVRNCGCPEGQQGRREPMAAEGQSIRARKPAPTIAARASARAERYRKAIDSRSAFAGGGIVWISRRSVDLPESQTGHRIGVWRFVSPFACSAYLEGTGVDASAAYPTGSATQRSGDHPLAHQHLVRNLQKSRSASPGG